MTAVKICGLKSDADIRAVNRYKPEYAGMVMFCPKSPRNVSCDTAKELLEMLGEDIESVAVTVSPTKEQMEHIAELGFDYIQIHGDVDEAVIADSRLPVIRALNISDETQATVYKDKLEPLMGCDKIAGVLFDAGTPGSGKTFNWKVAASLADVMGQSGFKTILAGGLNPENVSLAIEKIRPDVVDVSSGVEYELEPPGSGKDAGRIEAFIREVRQ